MAATSRPLALGMTAPDFDLPGVDGRRWRYADAAGPAGLVVAFICNHCPYVQAIVDRIVRDAATLRALGFGTVAISANDATAYPEDAPDRMAAFAQRHRFDFPYLHDESQAVARAYDAQCTPEFYGFDRERRLVYHGRLDASGRQPGPPDAKRELVAAMQQVAATGRPPADQRASIGCSIKWRDEGVAQAAR